MSLQYSDPSGHEAARRQAQGHDASSCESSWKCVNELRTFFIHVGLSDGTFKPEYLSL